MKKIMIRRQTVILTVALAAVLLAVCLFSFGYIHRAVFNHAADDLAAVSSNTARSTLYRVNHEFTMLESAAEYMAGAEDTQGEEAQRMLQAFVSANEFETVGLVSADGSVLLEVDVTGAVQDKYMIGRECFDAVLNGGTARGICELPAADGTGGAHTVLSVPVEGTRASAAAMFTVLDRAAFGEKFLRADELPEREIMLLDGNGYVLANSDAEAECPAGTDLSALFTGTGHEKFLTCLRAREGGFTVDEDSTWLAAGCPVEGTDWTVVTVIRRSAVPHTYDVKTQRFLSLCVIVLLMVSVFCAAGAITLSEQRRRKAEDEARLDKTCQADFNARSGRASFRYDSAVSRLDVSPEIERILGYRVPESWMSDLAERRRQHPEFDFNAVIGAVTEMTISGSYQEVLSRVRTAQGLMRWLRISISAVTGSDGRVAGAYGVIEDVTEAVTRSRKAKEELQSVSDQTLHAVPLSLSVNLTQDEYSVLGSAHGLGIDLPLQGKYSEQSPRLGALVPETHKQSLHETLSRESLMAACENGRRTVEQEFPLQEESGGGQRWLRATVRFLASEEGGDLCAVLVCMDITPQKETALLKQKSLDVSIENMPGLVCKWLFDGRDVILLEANRSFYRFMKSSEEQLTGRSVLTDPDTSRCGAVLADMYASVREKEDIRCSVRGVRADGEEYWCTVNGTYFSARDGRPVYLCVLSDITEVIRLQNDFLRFGNEMRTAADLCSLCALKYDVESRIITVVFNNTRHRSLTDMDGCTPEAILGKGIVPIVEDGDFFNAFRSIEQGVKEGDIRFVVKQDETLRWVNGRFRTIFSPENTPLSAVMIFNDDMETAGVEVAARMLTDFYDELDDRRRRLIIVNLTRDRLEYETGMEGFATVGSNALVFSKGKQNILDAGIVDEADREAWLTFMDSDRLVSLFRSGRTRDTMTFRANTRLGAGREILCDIMLQESKVDGSIRAYMLFCDKALQVQHSLPPAAETAAVPASGKRVFIRTFGYFEVYVDGKPIAFAHEKSKEMLAVLVDRRGGFVSTQEMIGYLWEDEESNKITQNRCRQVANRLKKILEDQNISEIVEVVNGRRRIVPEAVECDYFNFLTKRPEYRGLYSGSYMLNYSWAESTAADLDNSKLNG